MAVSRGWGADLKPIIKLYKWSIKALLGVRKSIPNDTCYAEAGFPSLPDLVRQKQHKFFTKMARERRGQADDPLMYAINVAMQANTTTGALISNFLNTDVPNIQSLLHNVHERISFVNGVTLCCVSHD